MKRFGEEFSFNNNEALWTTVGSYMDDTIRESIHNDMAPCDPDDFLKAYIRQDPTFLDLLKSEFSITDLDIENPIDDDALETAKQIRDSDEWNWDACKQLCELAGLEDEWEAADGESFEKVVFKAADMLGVVIA